MKIEHIPTDTGGGYGEMDLELFGDDRVRVEHRIAGFPGAPGEGLVGGRTDVVYVPIPELWKLLINDLPNFRFEDLSLDELRSAIDFARENGWSR